MFKEFIFHGRIWFTPIVLIYVTGASCVSRKSSPKSSPIPMPTPTTPIDKVKPGKLNSSPIPMPTPTTPIDEVKPGKSNSSVDSLNSEASGSSQTSNGSASSAVSPSPPPTAFAGLPNRGATCHMNAALQIIAALYADKVEASPLKDLITKINTTDKPLDRMDIDRFINSLPEGLAKNMTISGHHEDAEEFITHLNALYKFLSTITIIPYEYTLASRDAEDSLDPSTLREEQEKILTIPLKQNQSRSLNKMIDCYSIIFEQDIPGCFLLTRRGYRLPDRLFIKLHRHTESGRKITDDVNGAMHITIQLDFNKKNTNAFDLNGFITQLGNERVGHYIAYVKREGKWYKADDTGITEVLESEVREQSKQAYLFFYKKR